MKNGQAYFVVGHKSWGKSATLIALTGSHRERWHEIGEHWLYIRRMSNDDSLALWVKVLRSLEVGKHPRVILTLCPNRASLPALRKLALRYRLFFWVMRDNQPGTGEQIENEEIRMLRGVGTVEILEGLVNPRARAKRLKQFILSNLP